MKKSDGFFGISAQGNTKKLLEWQPENHAFQVRNLFFQSPLLGLHLQFICFQSEHLVGWSGYYVTWHHSIGPRNCTRFWSWVGDTSWHSWHGMASKDQRTIRLMEEILHQLIDSLSHYLQGFIHPRWCRISSINSITLYHCVSSFWWRITQKKKKQEDFRCGFDMWVLHQFF